MKAIIPAAGLGTRFLPGTKCTPKEMLPVLDKPVIQYVVEEALDPEEVDDAIIVTSPGKPELLNYFQPDRSLENLLRERGKNAYADAVAHAGGMPVDFRYQYEPKGLGHAIRSAADAVAGENFLVLLGDYVVPNRDICDKMLAVSKEHGGASVIAVAACSPEEVSRYGVIAGERVGSLEGAEDVADAEPGAVWRIGGLVEKPAPEAAPSNLYIVCKSAQTLHGRSSGHPRRRASAGAKRLFESDGRAFPAFWKNPALYTATARRTSLYFRGRRCPRTRYSYPGFRFPPSCPERAWAHRGLPRT